ncbi:hypothetical protein C8R44DRAFT_743325 [Mycena epipterygia]|nr:hypothetical protein C8R44DRAFT_743325 [Mycena epipterygia]
MTPPTIAPVCEAGCGVDEGEATTVDPAAIVAVFYSLKMFSSLFPSFYYYTLLTSTMVVMVWPFEVVLEEYAIKTVVEGFVSIVVELDWAVVVDEGVGVEEGGEELTLEKAGAEDGGREDDGEGGTEATEADEGVTEELDEAETLVFDGATEEAEPLDAELPANKTVMSKQGRGNECG